MKEVKWLAAIALIWAGWCLGTEAYVAAGGLGMLGLFFMYLL